MNKKEIKQLDLEEYIGNLEKELEKKFQAVITEVNTINSSDFFKDASGKYSDREGIAITVKIRDNDTEFSEFFSKPSLRGYGQSKLYAFKQKYTTLPKKGLAVECFIDENGFFKIAI